MNQRVLLFFILIAPGAAMAQPVAGAAPKILNMVHAPLLPERMTAYAFLEGAIVRGYTQANIPVYWLGLQAMTGPLQILYLNLFDSFAEAEKAGAAVSQGLAAHPDLGPMQDRLLGMVRNVTTVLTVRRDDLGYRTSTIDLAKMRLLRVTTFSIRPGHEAEFVEAVKSVAAAHEKVRADTAWMVYQVNAGLPAPAFVTLTPMRSLEDADRTLARTQTIDEALGPAIAERLQAIARSAYHSWESQLYVVNRDMSHVRKEFMVTHPEFWLSKFLPER